MTPADRNLILRYIDQLLDKGGQVSGSVVGFVFGYRSAGLSAWWLWRDRVKDWQWWAENDDRWLSYARYFRAGKP